MVIDSAKVALVGAETLINLTTFLMEYIKKYMLIKERVENVVIIFDCTGLSVWNFPYSLLRDVLKAIQITYKCVVSQIFCLNFPSYSLLDKTLKLYIDEVTYQKIIIESTSTSKELLE